MTRTTYDWRPAATLEGVAGIADLVSMLSSALDEAAAAFASAPARIVDVSVAETTVPDLPEELRPLASFELLGTTRRAIWVGLDPSAGSALGDAMVDPIALGTALLEGLDAGLIALVGEGLGLGADDAATLPADAELLLVRLAIRGDGDAGVDLIAAVERSVPIELATHVVALQALGTTAGGSSPASTVEASTASAPAPEPADAPASRQAQPAPAPATPSIRPVSLEEFAPSSPAAGGYNIDLLLGVSLQVTVEIGRARLSIREVLALTPGSIVELDKLAGEKVEVLVNGHPIAQGEVVVVDDNFGVRITDVVSRQRRIISADGAA